MNIAEKELLLKKDFDDVFEAGKTKERDDFWEIFQRYGETMVGAKGPTYNFAFAHNRFDDNTYNPKYPIVIHSNGSTLTNTYGDNNLITSTKVPIRITCNNITNGVFLNNSFAGCLNLETIVELHFGDGVYTNTTCFSSCNSLKNLTITGTIIKDFNVRWCPLTKASFESVVTALSNDVSDQTVTFSKSAKENAFTDAEWTTLIDTKPNWTFSLI